MLLLQKVDYEQIKQLRKTIRDNQRLKKSELISKKNLKRIQEVK